MIQFSYDLEKKDFLAFSKHYLFKEKQTIKASGRFRYYFLLALIFLFGFLIIRIFHSGNSGFENFNFTILFEIVFVAVLIFVIAIKMRNNVVNKQVNEMENSCLNGNYQVECHDGFLISKGPKIENRYQWSAFMRFEENHELIMLYIIPSMALIIPKKSVQPFGMLEEVISFFKRKIPHD